MKAGGEKHFEQEQTEGTDVTVEPEFFTADFRR
jgi:hypothetical protein